MFESLREGDAISWWDDGHGRGAEPGTEGALHRTGVVGQACRDPRDPSTVVALLVDCEGPLGGYVTTVRPDRGHRPELIDAPLEG